jgi:hypothetical protein
MDVSGDASGLDFVRADATRLPAKKGAFDLYVSFETIEHVEETRALSARLSEFLHQGHVPLLHSEPRLLSPGLARDRPVTRTTSAVLIAEFESLLGRVFPKVSWTDVVLGRHHQLLARVGRRSTFCPYGSISFEPRTFRGRANSGIGPRLSRERASGDRGLRGLVQHPDALDDHRGHRDIVVSTAASGRDLLDRVQRLGTFTTCPKTAYPKPWTVSW